MTTPKLGAFAILGSLVHLGLAVLGWGGVDAFFSHPPFIVLTVVLGVLSVAALCSSGSVCRGEREDRRNRWVLSAFGILGFLSARSPAFTDRKEFWTFDGDTLRWIGVNLFTVGGVVRMW